jgi:hypothetical protein
MHHAALECNYISDEVHCKFHWKPVIEIEITQVFSQFYQP